MLYSSPFVSGWLIAMVECPPENRNLGSAPGYYEYDEIKHYFEDTIGWKITPTKMAAAGMYDNRNTFKPNSIIPVFINDNQEVNDFMGFDILTEFSKEGIPLKVYGGSKESWPPEKRRSL